MPRTLTSTPKLQLDEIPTLQKMDSEYVILIYLQPTECAANETEKEKNRKMKNKTAITLTTILAISIVFASISQLMPTFAESTPSPTWRTKAPMPTARGQAAVITGDDGLIYVIGGFNETNTNIYNVTEAYNPLTNTWTTKAQMPQKTRGASVAKGLNGIIYVIGGTSGSAQLKTVQAYNTTSNTWSTKADALNATWMAGAATGNDGKIYLIGGESFPIAFYNNATQIYNPTTNSWTLGSDMPTGRSELGVVKGPDGLIYAIGGYKGVALSVVEAYNPSTDTWNTKASMPSPKLEFGVASGFDGNIYVVGGGTSYSNDFGPFFNEVDIYDHATDSWSITSRPESKMPTARKEFSIAMDMNGRLYAIGGANGKYLNTNEQGIIDNAAPNAYIDSISPNPALHGDSISLIGHGTDSDGFITAYKWRSSINGTISTSASFTLSTLGVGTHSIYFSVQDDTGTWSNEIMTILTVNVPITEDPTYQQLQTANQAISNLAQQNSNLTDRVNSLTQQLNTTTMILLGVGIVTAVLVVVTIVLVLMRKPKAAA